MNDILFIKLLIKDQIYTHTHRFSIHIYFLPLQNGYATDEDVKQHFQKRGVKVSHKYELDLLLCPQLTNDYFLPERTDLYFNINLA